MGESNEVRRQEGEQKRAWSGVTGTGNVWGPAQVSSSRIRAPKDSLVGHQW